MKLLIEGRCVLFGFLWCSLLWSCYDQSGVDGEVVQMNGFGTPEQHAADHPHPARLEVNRVNWDDFQADVQKADSLSIKVMDREGMELLNTSASHFSYSDGNFDSEEPFIVQCCKWVDDRKFCKDFNFKASQKRITCKAQITYPLERSVYLGSYRIIPEIHRVQFNQPDQLEKIESGERFPYGMTVYSSNKQEMKLHLDLHSPSGTFNLMYCEKYAGFKKNLEAEISENSGCQLNFELTTRWNHDLVTEKIQREIGTYESKDKDDAIPIHQYASIAARQLMMLVEPKSGYQSEANVHNWYFEKKSGHYAIDFNAQWKSEWYIDETMKVYGTLYVKPGSRNATFKLKSANDPVRDLEETQGQRLLSTLRLPNFSS